MKLNIHEYPTWSPDCRTLGQPFVQFHNLMCSAQLGRCKQGRRSPSSGLPNCPQCCLPTWRFTATNPADAEKAKNYGVRFQAVQDYEIIMWYYVQLFYLIDSVDFLLIDFDMLMLIDIDIDNMWQQLAPSYHRACSWASFPIAAFGRWSSRPRARKLRLVQWDWEETL